MAYERYSEYRRAKTKADALSLGATMIDLDYDHKRGYLKLADLNAPSLLPLQNGDVLEIKPRRGRPRECVHGQPTKQQTQPPKPRAVRPCAKQVKDTPKVVVSRETVIESCSSYPVINSRESSLKQDVHSCSFHDWARGEIDSELKAPSL